MRERRRSSEKIPDLILTFRNDFPSTLLGRLAPFSKLAACRYFFPGGRSVCPWHLGHLLSSPASLGHLLRSFDNVLSLMRFGEQQEDVCGEANRARRSRPPRAPHARPSHWGGPCGRGKRTAPSWQRRASPLSRVELLSPRHLKPMVNHCNECYQLARGPSCEAWQQFNMLIIPLERACML